MSLGALLSRLSPARLLSRLPSALSRSDSSICNRPCWSREVAPLRKAHSWSGVVDLPVLMNPQTEKGEEAASVACETASAAASVSTRGKRRRKKPKKKTKASPPHGRRLSRLPCCLQRSEPSLLSSSWSKPAPLRRAHSWSAGETDSKERDARNSRSFQFTNWRESLPETSRRERKVRPNFFVALPIKSRQIKERATDVQTMLVDDFPEHKKDQVPVILMHLTLLVCYLEKEDIEKASNVISDVIKRMALGPELFRVGVSGMGSFGRRVIFADVVEGKDTIAEISNELRRSFKDNNLMLTDNRAFTPHITLLKIRDMKKRFPQECLERHVNPHTYFGSEKVRSLQLCHMKKESKDGYYIIENELDLVSGKSVIKGQ